MNAEYIAPKDTRNAGILPEKNQRVCQRDEPLLDRRSQRLGLLRVMICNKGLRISAKQASVMAS